MNEGEADPASIEGLPPLSPDRVGIPGAGGDTEPGPGPPPGSPAEVPPPAGPLPGAWATLGGGLDLSFAANRELRGASLYIGALTLALVGPFVIIVLAFGAAQGGFDWVTDVLVGLQPDLVPVDSSVGAYLMVTGIVALIGLFVITIESQIMAAAILGGRALGRPMSMREALRRSRQVFWRVVRATLLVSLILIVPNLILNVGLESTFGATSEAPSLILTGVGALLAAPFAYIVSGIVLGDVGAGEAVRRSTLLARARWRLAIAVSAVGAVIAYIELFAAGAGVDMLARVGGVLHLGFDSSGGTAALGVVVLAGVLAIGSLTFTLAALRNAPQVVAFVGMTGYGAGLDRSREPSAELIGGDVAIDSVKSWDYYASHTPERRQDRWITIPMGVAIVIGVLAGAGGVLALT